MKICVITTSFPLFLGDYSGLFVFRLCKTLKSLNIKLDIVAPSHEKTAAFEIMEGCRIHRFQYFFSKKRQTLAYGPGGIPANLRRQPWLVFLIPFFISMFVIKALKVSKGADMIHAQWLYSGIIALFLKKMKGLPFVVTLRGTDVQKAQKGKLAALISVWVMKEAVWITTVNQEMKNWVVQEGIPSDTVSVIRNGVDLSGLHKKDPEDPICRFIFVGSLVPGKGVNILIQAFSSVHALEKNTHLLVVGEGEEADHLKAEVQKKGLSHAVEFLGRKNSDQIPSLMQKSDCLVLPSFAEGIPNVVLEAMACGLVVVASNLPGIREVLKDEETGFCIAPGDVEDLAQKLLILVRNPERRKKMGDFAYQHLSEMNLTWEKSAKQYLEVYKKVCAVSQESST
ncbi:MAG: glycosyltransferase family 4 protein [Nitrospirae bacterium]|nr:glycosyltransferase family 4 protein [Candidatus Manganitrophaceae bacterium]